MVIAKQAVLKGVEFQRRECVFKIELISKSRQLPF
jgi:hypothetical protein